MDSAAAIRRRRRRRVAQENRKRAPRAHEKVNASNLPQEHVNDVKQASSLVVSIGIDIESARQSESPIVAEDATAAASSQTAPTPQENISIDSHQTESILWPRFLTRLREAFSLEPISGPEAQDMVNLQAARLKRIVDSFPPRPIADFLIHVCIRRGTDVFFYFDQNQLLSEIDQFYSNTSCSLRFDPSFICLALTIFALGSHWTPLERPGASRIEERDPGRMFFQQAKMLVPDIIERPGLKSIQACFILGVYLMPMNAVGSSYVYMGMALRKALAFDLHQEVDDQALSEREREIRRRLWWSIYSLERCTTIKLSRPRSVSPDIIRTSLPSPLPELDNVQTFNNVPLQIAYARLVSILDKVADWELNGSMLGDKSSVENQLREWKKSLPEELDLESIHPHDSRYRAVFHLYLNYYYAWIVMGKASLIIVVRRTLQHHLGQDSQPLTIGEDSEKLSRSCTRASKKLLQLFEDLNQTGKTTRFSFTDFQGCSIATIVTLIAGILERDPSYERRVDFGLGFLRRMATGNPNAKVGVRFVETLQSISNEARSKLQQSRQPPPDSGDVWKMSTAYNDWAEWLANQEQSSIISRNEIMDDVSTIGATQPGDIQPGPETQFWSGSGPEQDIEWASSAGPIPQPLGLRPSLQQPVTGSQLDPLEGYQFSATYTDDQTFLLGLTGFDVLDFAGLPVDLE
ncbi:hypothetical protein F53441_13291 [Fusarium austroafricanum]|uniref:Xylanolytic transcriptional activator regulatory domain-containing protein n=1 Tax=Fusarium austroafricanum TaxID=2364996 RepID=A0A8H4JQ55_9HYPO|nr:hypothetical protein F53441_13291 [Fusarium austroafricanum]